MPHAKPNRLQHLPGRLWRDREGASLLEFTVVLPFLLAFGLGVLEFGNLLYQYHQVTSGVRDATRYLASAGYVDADENDAADPDEVDPGGINSTPARNIAVCGDPTNCTNAQRRVNWWPDDIANIETAINVKYCLKGVAVGDTIEDCECHDLDLNDDRGFGSNKVCVSTTATYGDLGFLAYLGLGPLTFTTGHEQRYYGIR